MGGLLTNVHAGIKSGKPMDKGILYLHKRNAGQDAATIQFARSVWRGA